jgi:hypothetical protein
MANRPDPRLPSLHDTVKVPRQLARLKSKLTDAAALCPDPDTSSIDGRITQVRPLPGLEGKRADGRRSEGYHTVGGRLGPGRIAVRGKCPSAELRPMSLVGLLS